ncbi:MAG: cobalt ECF transporter T component CbiQ [Actinomycetales bacterium]|nr:cobalt ECF transporter T component CbiQ [Actinomycetales bacterium]
MHGHSAVHTIPAHLKLLAILGFLLVVVSTPIEVWWAFPCYAAIVLSLMAAARLPAPLVARRMLIEVPFVVFALAMPVVGSPPRIEVLGLSLSEPGLWAGASVLAKATIGVLCSILLAATTPVRELLDGLTRLRVPAVLVQIAGFMVRYTTVVLDQMRRMRIARESRGFTARGPRQWRVIAAAAGALFVRAYERGERVYLAMLSRGFTGTMPTVQQMTHSHAPVAPAANGLPTPAMAATGPPRMPPASLIVERLAFAYPDGHQALFGVDLTIDRGERVALLGPNGAGKTTLVLHLNGILTAGHGTVTVAGLPVDRVNLPEIRRRVGIVFQDPDDQLFMPTVREDVAFGPANLGLRGEALQQRVTEALASVGMADFADRPPHHLSFGQRRRVAVATVLAMRPEILVLDEPSSNLDPASRRELAEILTEVDVTILMVTHDLPYALQLCPRAVVLSEGVIVADGATGDLLANPALMAAHRLELPFGFDPRIVAP